MNLSSTCLNLLTLQNGFADYPSFSFSVLSTCFSLYLLLGIGDVLGFPGGSGMVKMVNNPPAMQETQEMQARSLGWEDPLDEGMVINSSILAWKIPMDRGAWWAVVHGVSKSQTRVSN